jgi:hypothetical protein
MPLPRRNSNIILNNNLLYIPRKKSIQIQGKKKPTSFVFIINGKAKQNHKFKPWR